MYGYIRTFVPELKVREQEYYRAVYCGLCRTMGKCTGQCSRMTLTYDFTFFVLVRMALTGERPTFVPRRCFVHPTGRRLMAESNDALRGAAYLSSVLAYHKVRDDLRDEQGVKRMVATLAHPYLASLRRKADKRGYTEADTRIGRAMLALSHLEAARPPSVDEPADLFGDLMATLLADGLEGDQARLAMSIGRPIGRWVYILDAADDFEDDVRKGRYNPFACLYGDNTVTALSADRRESIRRSLLDELARVECAFDLMDISDDPDLTGVLHNILYHGLPRSAEHILCGECGGQTPVGKQKTTRRKHKHDIRK